MRVVNPIFLVLAALVPLAGIFWAFLRARREKSLDRLVAPALRTRLMPKSVNLWGLQAWFVITGLFLTMIAAARPQWGRTTEKVVERSRNVVVAIDVSRSMLAQDVRPNRLERAKADVADLIDSLAGDRCSLVAFRRTGVVVCPLTTDRAFLRSALEQFSPESAPRGETDLGSAIRAALDALDPAADDHNAIIMISDGGDLRGEALANAALAAKRKIPIFTIGIGDPRVGAVLPDDSGRGELKFKGETVKVRLEESALKAIAEASHGRYVPLTTAGTAETTLGAIYRRFLRQVAAKEQNEEAERVAERYQLFLIPALGLLMAGASLSKGRLGVIVFALILASFAGCLTSKPPQINKWSVTYAGKAEAKTLTANSVRITRVVVRSPYDGRSMPVLRKNGSLAFDDFNEFSSIPSILLKGATFDALTASGKFSDVVDSSSSLKTTHLAEVIYKTLLLDCSGEKRLAKVKVAVRLVSADGKYSKVYRGQSEAEAIDGDYGRAFSAAVSQALSAALKSIEW